MPVKRILITGGAGFIGSHLCSKLLEEGHEVICLDNFYSSTKTNVQDLLQNPRFKLIWHDITVPIHDQVDEIYNLACPASPPQYQNNPIKTIKTNVLGAINILEMAKDTGAKVLQASTSEVYGDPHIHPQTEDYWGNVNPIGERSCYDEGKRCAETLFFDYERIYNLKIKVVRIFNTYGPHMNQNDGRVVSNFIVQAIKGEDITIYGDGTQTRSFCYIDDQIEGMTLMMNSKPSILGPVNLGNPSEYSILELASKILSLTGSKSKLVMRPLPKDDPRKRQPDIQKAKTLLGWQPKVSLDDGLRETIVYFRKILETKK